ncbi:MAG: hypothetical protein ACTSRA_17125 [Promethearchaeota archaeon]
MKERPGFIRFEKERRGITINAIRLYGGRRNPREKLAVLLESLVL